MIGAPGAHRLPLMGEIPDRGPSELLWGVVIAVRPGWVLLRTGTREIRCQVPKTFRRGPRSERTTLAVGDRGAIEIECHGTGVLREIGPRRTKISRLDSVRPPREHVISANIDAVVAVQAVRQPSFHPGIMDRLLILGEAGAVTCAIGLNKVDLAGPGQVERLLTPYQGTGYPVFAVSALTGEGLGGLKDFLSSRRTALVGPSGAGKTALLNRLAPDVRRRTSPVNPISGRGVHSTTRVDFVDLPGGGVVIDTPGLRTVRPWGVPARRLADLFPEFRNLMGCCHFQDCLHRGEPGCAITGAVAEGAIPSSRYKSYLRILEDLVEEGGPSAHRDQRIRGE